MCNCEFCIKYDCGHKADEHIAGEDQCYICKCKKFHSLIVDTWEKLSIDKQKEFSFKEFADRWTKK